jgi:ubiquinone/menaquinone biosynthesis C-methylase UbiE
MNNILSTNVLSQLSCVYCGGDLEETKAGERCKNCSSEFELLPSGVFDMRLKKPKDYELKVTINNPSTQQDGLSVGTLHINKNPEIDYLIYRKSGLSSTILSYIPKSKNNNALMLDLGCGDGRCRKMMEDAGYEWVGLDIDSSQANILGDAHSIPFKDNTFEFILSRAVLEHIRHPYIMVQEAYRVLKPGGKFIGSVAFLEPFHGNSYYHHNHLGVINSLFMGGFKTAKIYPQKEWPVLTAQAQMGLYPYMPTFISLPIVYPAQMIHVLWWRFANLIKKDKYSEEIRIRNTTGAFSFIASKD